MSLKALLTALVCLVLEIGFVVFCVRPELISGAAKLEGDIIVEVLGEGPARDIARKAASAYVSCFAPEQAREFLRSLFLPDPRADMKGYGTEIFGKTLFRHVGEEIEALLLLAYWAALRVQLALYFAVLSAPMFFAFAASGLAEREMKLSSFSYASPLAERTASWTLWGAVLALLASFFAPVPGAPLAYGALFLLAGAACGRMVANFAKRL